MARREPLPHTAKRLATALMLLALLGTAGCMTWRPAATTTAGDVVSTIDPTIDLAERAADQCAQFACEP